MTDFAGMLQAIAKSDVEFIIIGGVAAAFHGAIRTTRDLDVVYRRTPEISRVSWNRLLRFPLICVAPPGLPFLGTPRRYAWLEFHLDHVAR